MDISFQNKNVFLTGGGGSIGESIKRVFLDGGAQVISPSSKELNLEKPEEIEKYIQNEIDTYPDIFIHCAGINELAGVGETDGEAIRRVFEVNFFSAVELLKAFAPLMCEKEFGRIVVISSLYGIVSKERRIPYSSSKHALNGLVKSTALEVARHNVLINAVAPGYVASRMTDKNLTKEEQEVIKGSIPTGRFQLPDEIASLCAFLCSGYNRSITGQIIAVDGGFLCR